jgi:hypothetical protein
VTLEWVQLSRQGVLVFRSTAAYLVKAWDVRNSCKHNGAVLSRGPLSSAPRGRGADCVDAMA